MKSLNKLNGIFLIFEGILIISFWIKFFITEGIDKLIDQKVLSAIFHLSSELMLAIFCILTSIGLFKNSEWSKRFIFFTFGFFTCSVINAGSLYLFDKEYYDFFMVMMFVFFLLIVLVLYFTSRIKYIMFSPERKSGLKYNDDLFIRGLLLYALINIAGYHGQIKGSHWGIFIVLMLCFLTIGYSTFRKLELLKY